jgi:hypothetical protein
VVSRERVRGRQTTLGAGEAGHGGPRRSAAPEPCQELHSGPFRAQTLNRDWRWHWLNIEEGKKQFREHFLEILRRFDEELTASGRPLSPQDWLLPLEKYLGECPELCKDVRQYLEKVWVYSHPSAQEPTKWIEPFPRGGPWNPKDALKTLADTVSSKVGKRMAAACYEFVLLLYYSQGRTYAAPLVLNNLPPESELLEAVRSRLPRDEDREPFSRAYLYFRPKPGDKALCLWYPRNFARSGLCVGVEPTLSGAEILVRRSRGGWR